MEDDNIPCLVLILLTVAAVMAITHENPISGPYKTILLTTSTLGNITPDDIFSIYHHSDIVARFRDRRLITSEHTQS